GGEAREETTVLLAVHPHVVPGTRGWRRWRAVGQRRAEVLVLEDLTEPLRTPVGEEELQAGLVAESTEAVVAEDPDDTVPDIGGLLRRDEDPEALGEPGRGGESATHPEVVPGAE